MVNEEELKNITKRIYYIFFVIFLIGCNQNVTNKSKLINFDKMVTINATNSDFEERTLSDILNIKEIVILEDAPAERRIVKIDKVIPLNSEFLIFDEDYDCLNHYSNKGKFLNSIGSLGIDPNQYLDIEDVFLDNERIFLFSINKQALMEFNLDGNKIETVYLGQYANNISSLNDHHYMFINYNSSGQNANIIVTDKLYNKIVFEAFEFDPINNPSIIGYSGFLARSNKKIIFSIPYSDVVYSLNDKFSLSADYKFAFSSGQIPDEIRNNQLEIDKNLMDYSFLNNNYIENSKHIVYTYTHNSKKWTGIYNKNSKKNYSFTRANNRKDFLELIIGNSSVGLVDNSKFIFGIDRERYTNCKHRFPNLYKEFCNRFPKIVRSVEESMDFLTPMLLICEI